jgi:hypothetical protein
MTAFQAWLSVSCFGLYCYQGDGTAFKNTVVDDSAQRP